ncbi:hypothetical protein HDU93_009265 [Gonapodya sp. JEL0774]|nr:hypothetical protein HDU93_009265 [Gonapodya sp. JEL0774]
MGGPTVKTNTINSAGDLPHPVRATSEWVAPVVPVCAEVQKGADMSGEAKPDWLQMGSRPSGTMSFEPVKPIVTLTSTDPKEPAYAVAISETVAENTAGEGSPRTASPLFWSRILSDPPNSADPDGMSASSLSDLTPPPSPKAVPQQSDFQWRGVSDIAESPTSPSQRVTPPAEEGYSHDYAAWTSVLYSDPAAVFIAIDRKVDTTREERSRSPFGTHFARSGSYRWWTREGLEAYSEVVG